MSMYSKTRQLKINLPNRTSAVGRETVNIEAIVDQIHSRMPGKLTPLLLLPEPSTNNSEMSVIREVICGLIGDVIGNHSQFNIVLPFKENKQLCMIKIKGKHTSKQRFSVPLQHLDGSLFDWQTGIRLTPAFTDAPVHVQPHLPFVNAMPANFEKFDDLEKRA